MSVFVDYLGYEFDDSDLIDKQYLTLGDRKTVLTGSFSPVKPESLEVGDTILLYQDYSYIEELKASNPHIRLGASSLGLCDARTLLPILLCIKNISFKDNFYELKFENIGGSRGIEHKKLYRFIG